MLPNKENKNLILSPSLLLALAAACQTRLCCRAMTASAMTRVTAAYTSTTRSVPPFVKSFNRDVIVMFLCNSSLTLFTQGNLSDGDLMLICITPDQDGKFGFNVKVGLTRLVCLFFSPREAVFIPLNLYSMLPTRVVWIKKCLWPFPTSNQTPR